MNIPRKKLKLFLPVIVIIIVVISINYYLIATKPKIKEAKVVEDAWQVDTIQAKVSTYHPSQKLFGKLNTENVIKISASVEADVVKLNVASGELVQAGRVMVLLNKQKLRNALDKTKAKITQTQLEIKQAKTNLNNQKRLLEYDKQLLGIQHTQFDRIEKLTKLEHRSSRDFEASKEAKLNREIAVINRNKQMTDLRISVDKLNARLKSEQADLDNVKLDLKNSIIKAPVTGLLLNVFVQVGSRVGVRSNIAEVLPIDKVEFEAILINRQMPQIFASLEANQPIGAAIILFGKTYQAWLVRLKGMPNLAGQIGIFRLAKVDASVLNKIRPNLNVPIDMRLTGIEGAIAVPYSSVYGTDKVFVIREGRLVGVRMEYLGSVKILQKGRTELWALIRSADISAGEPIMITHLPNANTGMKIIVLAP